MQKQRTRDTEPEIKLRRLLHSRGLRYRVDSILPLPGVRRRADIVFGPTKVAVFVDGCFWHGCPEHGNPNVKSNTWYWPEKIERNRARDADTDDRLHAAGWVSVRVWAHEDVSEVADRVGDLVRCRRR
jgi:DNA mismatch endonuclease, patch repair protein